MTNRPEWISAVFGISLAGGVAVTLSTFSTPAELDYLLAVVVCFGAVVRAQRAEEGLRGDADRAGAGIATSRPARCSRRSTRSCARLAMIGEAAPGIESWDDFLARRATRAARAGRGDGRGGAAERCRGAVLLVGLHQQAQRHPQRAPRCLHPDVALPAHVRIRPGRPRPVLVGERLLLVRQFRDVARRDAGRRRCSGAAADVRGRRGARPDGRRAGELPVRLAAPVGAARSRAELEPGGPEQHAVRRLQDTGRPPSDGVDQVVRAGPCLRQHRNLHDHNVFPCQHARRGHRRQHAARRCPA